MTDHASDGLSHRLLLPLARSAARARHAGGGFADLVIGRRFKWGVRGAAAAYFRQPGHGFPIARIRVPGKSRGLQVRRVPAFEHDVDWQIVARLSGGDGYGGAAAVRLYPIDG